MPTDRGHEAPMEPAHSDERSAIQEEAEALGVQKRPHGDVARWLEHNVEDDERGPVSHVDLPNETDQATAAPPSTARVEDNLVRLPIGAQFGLDHEPSPREREELVRFAAAADAELRGYGEGAVDEPHSEQEQRQEEQDRDAKD